MHKGPCRLGGDAGALDKHQDQAVAIRGFDTMHDTGGRKDHAAGLDGDIVALFERYDAFSLNDIKNLVLHGVLVEPGGLSRFETDKIAYDALRLHDGFAHKVVFRKFGEFQNFVVFYAFDKFHGRVSLLLR